MATGTHKSPLLGAAGKRHKRHERFGAFDIETNGLGGECLYCTWAWEVTTDGKIEKRASESINVFIQYVLDNPKIQNVIWFAHNGGFDMSRSCDYLIGLIESGYEIDIVESGENNIVSLNIKLNEQIVFIFRDSMKIYQGSLLEFTKQFGNGVKKLENVIDFDAGEIFDKHNPAHVEYAMTDTLSLLNAVINFERRLLVDFGIELKMTSASCAMKAWRTTLRKFDKYKRLSTENEEFARKCYYGGFVYLGEKSREKVSRAYHLDIRSSYPAAMEQFGVPSGDPIEVDYYEPGDIGLYEVEILNADGLTIAPYRTKYGVAWPRGSFKTYLTSLDLENLTENGTLFHVEHGLRFVGMIYPFTEFIGQCKNYRVMYEGTAGETTAKLMQNSLYGKFGAKPEITKIVYRKDGTGGFGFKDIDDELEIVPRGTIDDYAHRTIEKITAPYLLPHWAAFITAGARLRLHRMIRVCGFENFIYADTDSIVCNDRGYQNILLKAPELLGNEYGQFKLEKIYRAFRVSSPKVYASEIINKTFHVEHNGRAKGVPKQHRTEEFFKSLLNDTVEYNPMYYDSVSNLKSVFKGNDYTIERKRTLSKLENSKNWIVENGLVKPIKIG